MKKLTFRAAMILSVSSILVSSFSYAPAADAFESASSAEELDILQAGVILEPVIFEPNTEVSRHVVLELPDDQKAVLEPDFSVGVFDTEGTKLGYLPAAMSIGASSSYVIDGQSVIQEFSGQSASSAPAVVVGLPTFVRSGEPDDLQLSTSYRAELAEPGRLPMTSNAPALRAAAVFNPIAPEYIYDLNHPYPGLHDYCTAPAAQNYTYQDASGGITFVDFRGPCSLHDLCIEGPIGQLSVIDQLSNRRNVCDPDFRVNLEENCNFVLAGSPVGLAGCIVTANGYYAAVESNTTSYFAGRPYPYPGV